MMKAAAFVIAAASLLAAAGSVQMPNATGSAGPGGLRFEFGQRLPRQVVGTDPPSQVR